MLSIILCRFCFFESATFFWTESIVTIWLLYPYYSLSVGFWHSAFTLMEKLAFNCNFLHYKNKMQLRWLPVCRLLETLIDINNKKRIWIKIAWVKNVLSSLDRNIIFIIRLKLIFSITNSEILDSTYN